MQNQAQNKKTSGDLSLYALLGLSSLMGLINNNVIVALIASIVMLVGFLIYNNQKEKKVNLEKMKRQEEEKEMKRQEMERQNFLKFGKIN